MTSNLKSVKVELIKNTNPNYDVPPLISDGIFLISVTTLFSIMQNSINYIWRIRVKSKKQPRPKDVALE